MLGIPSLPFLPSASLPELVWVLASLIGTWLAARAWWAAGQPRSRLKNGIRMLASGVFLVDGVIAMLNGPAQNPTWLSVLTPMAITFGVVSMALLSVIDEQAKS